MERIEKAIREAARKSPSLKKLVDLQDAYIHATKTMHTTAMNVDEDYANMLVRQSCQYAIQCHAVWMATKANAGAEFIRILRESDSFPWHETVYVFADKIPSISELIEREIEEITL